MSQLPDYETALQAGLALVEPISECQTIALQDAICRTLGRDACTDRDLPPFNRAQMDGYAIRHADLTPGGRYPVVDRVSAGMSGEVDVPVGSCVAIATGAPVPAQLDTVVQHELSDRQNPVTLQADDIALGHALHRQGADASVGSVVIAAGTVLKSHHLGILASVGQTTVSSIRPVRIVLLTSGDEVIEPGMPVQAHQIRNSNRIQMRAMFGRMGASVIRAEHIPDDRDATIAAVGHAVGDADLVITIGGVSAGERDYFPDAFDAAQVERVVKGAAIQPGKPVVIGKAPSGSLVLALPGNPVSALACGCLFGWPLVRALHGDRRSLPWRSIALAEPVKPNPRRRAFRPARLLPDGDQAVVPRWQGSGDLVHTASTDGLVRLPIQSDRVEPGAVLPFLPWPSA